MSQQVIKRTQDMLGKYVTKPQLTEKLLLKPPFRYLHDILNVVIKEHGFLDGLFTDQELSSENIKDKDAKIIFLQKWIDATSIAIGEPLNVRPNKIVAGHEAENTNLLLQALAKGLDRKVDSSEAVKEVLSKSKDSTGPKKEKSKSDSKKEKPSSKPKASSGDKGPPKKEPSGPKPPKKETPAAKKTPNDKNALNSKEGTVVKKDAKADKSKSKEKKDGSKSKSKDSKSDKDKKDKEDKPKSKSKAADSSKSKKPDVPSEKEKENAPPPLPPPSVEETAVEDVDDMIIPQEEPEPLIQKSAGSAKSIMNDDDPEGDDFFGKELPDDGIQTNISAQGLVNEEASSLLIIDDNPPEENSPPLSRLNTMPAFEDLEDDPIQRIESAKKRPRSEIDPAILKAMGGHEMNLGGDPFNEVNQTEPSDSGVGSLESPKVSGKIESLPNEAESKPRSPVPIPPTPGPRPSTMKAYHPDLPDYDPGPNDDIFNNQPDEPPERPKTGMSIRPRTGRKSARPPSARPAPPKVRERREIPQEEIPRPPTGKPVPNVILDSDNKKEDEDEEDENFTVGSTKPVLDDEAQLIESSKDPNLEKNKQELIEGDQDAKGILVAQILETKKELEDNRREAFSPETPGHRRVPIEHAFQGDAGRRKEKELIQKDVEKLTSSIQALTRSVNPLAKMLDYLQEDFDSMQKELENWRKENKTLSQSLKSEQSLTDQQLEPLNQQLEEMDSAIYDQHDKISAIKAIILRNDERISRLLAGINIKS